jgi:hypothetical protein
MSELIDQYQEKVKSVSTLSQFLQGKDDQQEDLTGEELEILIAQLEEIEEFLITNNAEMKNFRRSYQVKEKRFRNISLN